MAPKFDRPRYTIELVRRFETRDMRTLAFAFEADFGNYIQQSVQVLPVSGQTPADQPRFVLSDGKRSLNVSNKSINLSLEFKDGLPAGDGLAKLLATPIALMNDTLKHIDKARKYFNGAVLTVRLPTASADSDVAKMLGERLLSGSNPSLSAVGVTTTNVIDGLNVIQEYSQFKGYRVQILVTSNSMSDIDTDFIDPTDRGLQIKVDVNTKPFIASGRDAPEFNVLADALIDQASEPLAIFPSLYSIG